jgi:hypothetical protein
MKRHLYDERKNKKCYKSKIDEYRDLEYLPQLFKKKGNMYKLEWNEETVKSEASANCHSSCKKQNLKTENETFLSDLYNPINESEVERRKYRKFLLQVIL